MTPNCCTVFSEDPPFLVNLQEEAKDIEAVPETGLLKYKRKKNKLGLSCAKLSTA